MLQSASSKTLLADCNIFIGLFHQSCKPCDHAVWEKHEHEDAEDVGGQEEHAAFEDLRRAGVFADARDDEAGDADGRRYRA